MTLRPASTEDLLYILALEQKFREMRLLGGSDPAVHQRQLANPDCLYWIVETESGPAGFVILRDIHSKDGMSNCRGSRSLNQARASAARFYVP